MSDLSSTPHAMNLHKSVVALVHYAVEPVVGGVERVIREQADLFRAHGWSVRTVARRGRADICLAGIDPTEELRAAVDGCDVVIVHNVLGMPFDMLLTDAVWKVADEQPAKRWIGWVHDLAAVNPDYDQPWHRAPWDRLTRAHPAIQYVAVSPHRARQFSALTGQEAAVVPNGIDPATILGLTESVRDFAGKHRLLDREILLVHPTRLVRRKNVECSLEVIAELRRNERDAALVVTGASDPHHRANDAYAAQVRTRWEELGLGDAVFFASDEFAVEARDISSLYAIADALLLPSRQEGFGLPVLEAAMQRLPIFCSDIEPLNGLLDHGVHVFDPAASADEIAQTVVRTLERSPAYRARREVLRRYAWDAVWARHFVPLFRVK